MVTTTTAPTSRGVHRASRRPPWLTLVVWAGLIATAVIWGNSLPYHDLKLRDAAPLFSGIRHHPVVLRLLPAAAVAVAVAATLPALIAALRWRRLLAMSWLASLAWTIGINAIDGWHGLVQPLTTPDEYLTAVPAIGSLHGFLQQFTTRLPTYPTHVKGHGPLAVLSFWALAKAGAPQPGAAAAMVIIIGTSSIVAVAITVRLVAGEQVARQALPFLVLLPAAIWVATTADAMFMGVVAWGVAMLAMATDRQGLSAFTYATAGGLLFGAALYMSYGLLVLVPLPLAVLVLRRRIGLLAPTLIGTGLVALFFSLEGFSYVAGFNATHRAWAAGVGPNRSRPYFIVGDLADLAIATGPVAALALGRLRNRRLLFLVGSVVIAVLASDLSGFVRGEAERIWLPFMPWLLTAAGDLSLSRRQLTALLLAQAALALLVQAITYSPW